MSKKRKGSPIKYRVRNWSVYNSALKKRGEIVFMIALQLVGLCPSKLLARKIFDFSVKMILFKVYYNIS